jgi:hypothetical protein
MDVDRIAPGLGRWTGFHAEWEQDVGGRCAPASRSPAAALANRLPSELRPSKPRADSTSAGGISNSAANDARP